MTDGFDAEGWLREFVADRLRFLAAAPAFAVVKEAMRQREAARGAARALVAAGLIDAAIERAVLAEMNAVLEGTSIDGLPSARDLAERREEIDRSRPSIPEWLEAMREQPPALVSASVRVLPIARDLRIPVAGFRLVLVALELWPDALVLRAGVWPPRPIGSATPAPRSGRPPTCRWRSRTTPARATLDDPRRPVGRPAWRSWS